MATIATAPGCSTIWRSFSPQRSIVIPIRLPLQATSEESGCTGDLDERERDLHHAVEIRDRDVLVRRVDVRHAVRKVDTAQAAFVERVRVGGASRQGVAHCVPGALERFRGETHYVVALREAVAAI